MNVTIRRAECEDGPAIDAFVRDTYGAFAAYKGAARRRWQLEENPFRLADGPAPSLWLAMEDNHVIGQIAVQDGRLRLAGVEIDAGWIVDVMVRPEYRGKGLGHSIHERIMRERLILVTLTMAPATRRIAEKAGCVTLGPTRQLCLPLKLSGGTVSRFVTQKTKSKPYFQPTERFITAAGIASHLIAVLINAAVTSRAQFLRSSVKNSQHIEEIVEFTSDFDHLWNATRNAFPAIFDRSSCFLNWRFVRAPDLLYRKFVLRHGSSLRGYVVTRRGCPEELPVGVIADLFAHPDDTEALNALIEHAILVLAAETEYLEAAASTASFYRAFRRAGFVPVSVKRPTVVCVDPVLKATIEETKNGWHFTKADHDWDQIHPV